MNRRPDGRLLPETPEQAARLLQAEAPDWTVWWGPETGRFLAMPLHGPDVLLQTRDIGDMVQAMAWHRQARVSS